MAKKVVATLKKEKQPGMTKVIRAVKNESGSYSFKEEIVPTEQVQEYLNTKK